MEPAGISYLPHSHVVPLTGIVGCQHGELACRYVCGRVRGDVEPAELVGRGPFFGLGEPDIPLAGVVQYIVHVDFDAFSMSGIDKGLEICLGAVLGIDLGVILHVVTMVGISRVGWGKPQRRYSEGIEIVQFRLDAVEVSYAVSVTVSKTIDKQLVGDVPLLLPGGIGRAFERRLSGILFLAAGREHGGQHQNAEKSFHGQCFLNRTCKSLSGACRQKVFRRYYSTTPVPALKS